MNNFIKNTFKLTAVLSLFWLTASAQKNVNAALVTIPYGSDNHIAYDLKTGVYTVYQGKNITFSKVVATLVLNGKALSSKSYSLRVYTKTPVTDGFGKGTKYVISLTGNKLSPVKQVFYTYPEHEYFLTQIEAAGKTLQSNSITPFAGELPAVSGDARSVFVPFDNDTFIRYNAKPFVAPLTNMSAEVGAVYDNDSRHGFIAGSVEHEVWKTGIRSMAKKDSANALQVWSGYTEKSVTRDGITHGMVKGNVIKSPKILVGYFDDWRTGMEEYAKANRIAEPQYVFNWTKPTPVGWNSWGVMQEKLTYEKATKVADFFADSLGGFRTGNTAFIDLDSYWDFMVKGGLEGDYSKLKEFADYCKSKGLQPGVYWAPFTD